jgi:hypothetical protein
VGQYAYSSPGVADAVRRNLANNRAAGIGSKPSPFAQNHNPIGQVASNLGPQPAGPAPAPKSPAQLAGPGVVNPGKGFNPAGGVQPFLAAQQARGAASAANVRQVDTARNQAFMASRPKSQAPIAGPKPQPSGAGVSPPAPSPAPLAGPPASPRPTAPSMPDIPATPFAFNPQLLRALAQHIKVKSPGGSPIQDLLDQSGPEPIGPMAAGNPPPVPGTGRGTSFGTSPGNVGLPKLAGLRRASGLGDSGSGGNPRNPIDRLLEYTSDKGFVTCPVRELASRLGYTDSNHPDLQGSFLASGVPSDAKASKRASFVKQAEPGRSG